MRKYSIPLIVGVVLGMIIINAAPDWYHRFWGVAHGGGGGGGDDGGGGDHRRRLAGGNAGASEVFDFWGTSVVGHPFTLHFIINDIFMAFFFGIAAVEITEVRCTHTHTPTACTHTQLPLCTPPPSYRPAFLVAA